MYAVLGLSQRQSGVRIAVFFCAKATEEFLSSKGGIGLPCCDFHPFMLIVSCVPGEVLRDGSIHVTLASDGAQSDSQAASICSSLKKESTIVHRHSDRPGLTTDHEQK